MAQEGPEELYGEDGKVKREVYEYLEGATPEKRREIVLRLIEEHPHHRLELPELEDGTRAHLEGLDLSPEALKRCYRDRIAREGLPPPWWDRDLERANLEGANLQGTYLSKVQLQDANLVGANLQGAGLWGAQLQRADLWGAQLQGADLGGTNLQHAFLWHAQLQRAHLWGAQLQRADLWGAQLQGAVLMGAQLQGADLRGARLEKVHLHGAWLDRTRLRAEQLGGAIGEELKARESTDPEQWPEGFEQAGEDYLGLKRNFEGLGYYDDALWAYRKERRMDKLVAKWKGQRGKYWLSELMEVTTDYATSPARSLLTLGVVYLFFATIYAAFNYGYTFGQVLVGAAAATRLLGAFQSSWLRGLSAALTGMVAMGARAIDRPEYPQAISLAINTVAAFQSVVTVFLTGLLGFIVANRIRRV